MLSVLPFGCSFLDVCIPRHDVDHMCSQGGEPGGCDRCYGSNYGETPVLSSRAHPNIWVFVVLPDELRTMMPLLLLASGLTIVIRISLKPGTSIVSMSNF